MERKVIKMKSLFNKYLDGLKTGEITIKQFQDVFNKEFDELLDDIESDNLNQRVQAELYDMHD